MGVNITERDIYIKQQQIFDNGDIDVKIARSCVVAIIGDKGSIYYLTLSTNNNNVRNVYQKYKEKYYMLKRKKVQYLAKTSLVNLESIYKGNLNSELIAVVPVMEYFEIIKKFITWQEKHPHKLYPEVKQLLIQNNVKF